jgi:ribosomal-protein-alanine N-acetyltransferase
MKILETERLYLREFRVDDAEDMFNLNSDFEVIQYTGDVAFKTIQDAKILIENYDHYQKYGFGRWAVIEKETEEFLGWCGLKYSEEKDEYDIGYRFFKKHWNKGFASESSLACLEFGFSKFKMKKIVGRVMLENIASIKVLEKIGLSFDKYFDFDGQKGGIYKIELK